jgi:hypothetical protein
MKQKRQWKDVTFLVDFADAKNTSNKHRFSLLNCEKKGRPELCRGFRFITTKVDEPETSNERTTYFSRTSKQAKHTTQETEQKQKRKK